MKKKIFPLLLLCLFMVSGCKEKEAYTPYDKTADILTVSLEENATTGYVWGFTITDNTILEYKNDELKSDNKGVTGSGGIHEFVFAGKAEGKTTILFLNKRDWEKDEAPAGKIIIEVTTDAKGNIKEVVELENETQSAK